MSMEQVQISIRRSKPKENRIQASFVFLNEGTAHQDKNYPNEPTFYKVLDGELKKRGFLGLYPKDQKEADLFKAMRSTPKKHLKNKAYAPAKDAPTEEELDKFSDKKLQELCYDLEIKASGNKTTLINRIRSYMIRELGYINTNNKGEPSTKLPKDPDAITKKPKETVQEYNYRMAQNIRENLNLLKESQLQKLCHRYGLSPRGSKQLMYSRVLEYRLKKVKLTGKALRVPVTAPEIVEEAPPEEEGMDQEDLDVLIEEAPVDTPDPIDLTVDVDEEQIDISELSYKELKEKAKELELSGRGDTETLRKRIEDKLTEAIKLTDPPGLSGETDIEAEKQKLFEKLIAAGKPEKVARNQIWPDDDPTKMD